MPNFLKNTKKLITWIIILLIFSLIGYWIVKISHSRPAAQTPDDVQTVSITPITYHTLPKTVTAYGTIISPKSVALNTQTAGTITAINFKPGQHVSKGQVLFTLTTSDISTQAKGLYAAMLSSKSLYDRQKRGNKLMSGSFSKYAVQKSKLQYEQDLAAYQESQAIEHIKAPIDGTISDTDLTVGSYIPAGQFIAHLVDPTSLQVKYQLPSQYAEDVHTGQHIQFFAGSLKQAANGIVTYVSPQFDADNYNLTLRADIHSTSLKPQLFGHIKQVLNPNYKTLAIPQALVQADAQGFYALVIDHNKVAKLYFSAGDLNKNGLIDIQSGIKAGTPIISSQVESLSVGQTVKVNK